MENANATSLYVQACKFLLCGEDRSSWDQLMAILPQLRKSLTCRVCRGLIVDPLSSGYCQHYVCRSCLKRKRALNPGCKWCLDFSTLKQSDEQIRVVLACYKLLCDAIKSSSYYANSDKNLTIDNLLKEAKLNTDVLPNSSLVNSNNSTILQKMADNAVACDQQTTTNNGGKSKIKSTHEIITSGITEHSDTVDYPKSTVIDVEVEHKIGTEITKCNKLTGVTTEERNSQLPASKRKTEMGDTDTNFCDAIRDCVLAENNSELNAFKVESNNTSVASNDQVSHSSEQVESEGKDDSSEINNNGGKSHLIRKIKNKRACLRPRNGQMVQKFEPGRKMRKRKLVNQTLSRKDKPKKKCKIG